MHSLGSGLEDTSDSAMLRRLPGPPKFGQHAFCCKMLQASDGAPLVRSSQADDSDMPNASEDSACGGRTSSLSCSTCGRHACDVVTFAPLEQHRCVSPAFLLHNPGDIMASDNMSADNMSEEDNMTEDEEGCNWRAWHHPFFLQLLKQLDPAL